MKSLLEIVRLSKQYVRDGKIARPDFEVEEWIASCLGMKRFDLYVRHDYPLEPHELDLIRTGLKSLQSGVPLAYLQHEAHFWNDSWHVTEGVLIPRPETEQIVERALVCCKKHGFHSVVDVCSGSGCIGLSIKKEIPNLQVCLIDMYDQPLQVARTNRERLGLDVEIRRGDLLDSIRDGEVELVVCNPPYLSQCEWETLDVSVKHFEPKEALCAGATGLELYERLFRECSQKGVRACIVEIGLNQEKALVPFLSSCGFASIDVFSDLTGRFRGIEVLIKP